MNMNTELCSQCLHDPWAEGGHARTPSGYCHVRVKRDECKCTKMHEEPHVLPPGVEIPPEVPEKINGVVE